MKIRNILVVCLLTVGAQTAFSQDYYDITQYYLENSLFDSNYDYDITKTGNVSEELLEIDGWTAAHTAGYTISGIYQIGTPKTFNGASIPSKNVDGTDDGGVLALSTGWEQSLIFTQSVSLPAGKYKLVTAYYNGDASKTAGKSLFGWIPASGTSVMSKVAAFDIGKWITDTLSFTLTAVKTGKIQIGFKGAAGGSVNSAKIAVDYVKLLRDTPYGDTDLAAYKSKLKTLLSTANSQYGTGTKRGSVALKAAIDEAQAVYDSATVTFAEIDEAYEKLDAAVNVFKALQSADTALKTLIATATNTANRAAEGEADSLLTVINQAQAVYDDADATVEQLDEAKTALQAALDIYNYSHPTGAVPIVKTDSRYARGATMAFGRLTVTPNGATIKERGFCWSENPEPTIHDNRSSKTLTGSSSSGVNGTIYWMQNLQPATKYYMRAYAITSGYQVAYGESIRFYTIPKGTINLQMRSGGDQATYDRIKKASESAVDYWNNLTEMKGFSPSVGFVDGTPTADCSYGGWIRVGSNSSYQRTGTILHEMLHGIGVIPWADTEWSRHNLRSGVNGDGYGTGYWLGDRVTAVVRFLQNSTTAQLNGDYQHMWPFGINGASEDSGEAVLYIANGLVCQALGEDGLQHTSSLFAEPYYALEQEDTVKYYLKNESANRGLSTSFLMPTSTGALKWIDMTAADASQNDSAAWYITFTPGNQYYQFRNAATGQYLSYSSGIKTMAKENLSSNENWHLMKGRVDVDGMRGYWIIHPESNWTPHCLQANANQATASAVFNIANTSETQRWLILTYDEAAAAETKAFGKMKTEADDVLKLVKTLSETPHSEEAEGTDEMLATTLESLTARIASATTVPELSAIIAEAKEAAAVFLQNVTAIDPEKPFDLTYLLVNPTLDTNAEGWSLASASANYGCVEFYEKTFDFNQTVKQLPAGTYKFCAEGFQRPGSYATVYSDYQAGTNKVNALIYAGSNTAKLANICDTILSKKIGKGNEATLASGKYVPNDMQSASAYFANRLYENGVITTVANNNASLKVGIKSASMPSYYWAIFDDFRLYFYGKMSEEALSVKTLDAMTAAVRHSVYSLDGRRLDGRACLKPGLYIVDGKKVVVR
jgi:hypothetical protein